MTAEAESTFLTKILGKKKAIERNRYAFERQWLTNIAFLYGMQHFSLDKQGARSGSTEDRIAWEFKNLDRKKKTYRTSNYILPLFRSLLARMLRMKSRVQVEPETQTERDINDSRVGKEVLEDLWQNINRRNPVLSRQYCGMQQTLYKLFAYQLSLGCGILKPYFNKNTKAKAYLNEQVVEGPIGEVEVRCLHPFEYFPDPMGRFAFECETVSVDDIEDEYGVKVDPEDIGVTEIEKQLLNLLEGASEEKYENCCRRYQYYEIPSKAYPNGQMVVFVEKKIIYQGPLPAEYRGRTPYYEFDYLRFPLTPYAQGMVDQLISLQEDYNFTVKRIADYKKWMTGKLMMPEGTKLSGKWDDEVGQIVKYTGNQPAYMNAPAAGNQLFEDLMRIRKDMEDIAATHDASMSRVPQGVKSGVAIENLVELDNSQLGPQLITTETQLSFFADTLLEIVAKRYTERRILNITGDQYGAEVKSFTGSEQLAGGRRVRISLGSGLSDNKEQRQAQILGLAKEGYITKEKATELLEFGDIDGVYTDIDKNAEKTEIGEMLKGVEFNPAPFENHAVRLKVLEDYMKGDQFKKLPEDTQVLIYTHYLAHQDYLMAEVDAEQGGPQAAPPQQPQAGASPQAPQ
jgi:hypothetical protein